MPIEDIATPDQNPIGGGYGYLDDQLQFILAMIQSGQFDIRHLLNEDVVKGYIPEQQIDSDLAFEQSGQWIAAFKAHNGGREPSRDEWLQGVTRSTGMSQAVAAHIYDQNEKSKSTTGQYLTQEQFAQVLDTGQRQFGGSQETLERELGTGQLGLGQGALSGYLQSNVDWDNAYPAATQWHQGFKARNDGREPTREEWAQGVSAVTGMSIQAAGSVYDQGAAHGSAGGIPTKTEFTTMARQAVQQFDQRSTLNRQQVESNLALQMAQLDRVNPYASRRARLTPSVSGLEASGQAFLSQLQGGQIPSFGSSGSQAAPGNFPQVDPGLEVPQPVTGGQTPINPPSDFEGQLPGIVQPSQDWDTDGGFFIQPGGNVIDDSHEWESRGMTWKQWVAAGKPRTNVIDDSGYIPDVEEYNDPRLLYQDLVNQQQTPPSTATLQPDLVGTQVTPAPILGSTMPQPPVPAPQTALSGQKFGFGNLQKLLPSEAQTLAVRLSESGQSPEDFVELSRRAQPRGVGRTRTSTLVR
jgi:hypothetical protein